MTINTLHEGDDDDDDIIIIIIIIPRFHKIELKITGMYVA
jgi:hypothetical protein